MFNFFASYYEIGYSKQANGKICSHTVIVMILKIFKFYLSANHLFLFLDFNWQRLAYDQMQYNHSTSFWCVSVFKRHGVLIPHASESRAYFLVLGLGMYHVCLVFKHIYQQHIGSRYGINRL